MRSSLQIMLSALAVSVFATVPAAAVTVFDDVPDDTWYSDPVAWMVAEDITTGTEPGCFSPTTPVTRGQIVTFLYRLDAALGHHPETAHHPFEDVLAAYQQEPVGWAYQAGVTKGTSAATFAPDDEVTRGDFAVMLWRYAGEPAADDHPFVDVTRPYQQTAIAWMAENHITTGTTAITFSPEDSMTRAEAATFLFRFVDPTSFTMTPSSEPCAAPLRDLLTANGLTPAEAVCVAPYLADLDLDTVLGALAHTVDLSGELLLALSKIAVSGCIAPERQATVIALFV